MRKQIQSVAKFVLLVLTLVFTGCMRSGSLGQDGSGVRGGTGGLFSSDASSAFNSGSENLGGSNSGVLTNPDISGLQNVAAASDAVSVSGDANAKKLGIDSLISKSLTDEINALLKRERENRDQDFSAAKYALAGEILKQCAAKTVALVPIPGQPLIGDWTGAGGCGLANFSINGPGNKQIYPGQMPGADTVQVAAYKEGNFELRTNNNKWSGKGEDTKWNGQNLSGTGLLKTQIPRQTKYGTQYTECQTGVRLVTSRNPIPENYKTAVKVMGSCYRKGLAFLGMDAVFKNVGNEQFRQVLLDQMLK